MGRRPAARAGSGRPQRFSAGIVVPRSVRAGDLRRLLTVQVMNASAESLAWGFIYIQALAEGHGEAEIALFMAVVWSSAALTIPAMGRPVPVRGAMALGLGLRAFSLALAIGLASLGMLLAAAAVNGMFIALFWIPYNAVFFRYTSDTDRAGRSTQLFALFAVIAALAPLLGAQIIDRTSYTVALGAGIALLLVGACLVSTADWGARMRFRLVRSLRRGRPLAALTGLEGLWQGVFWLVLPLGTIRMVDQVSVYGGFLAFLGIVAGVASVLAGRWSDRARDRRVPLLVSAVGVAVATVLVIPTVGNLTLWTLAVGMTSFFTYMMMAFTFTVVAELSPSFDDAMGLREFMFNAGRAGGVAVVVVAIWVYGSAWEALTVPLVVASAAMVAMMLGYARVLGRRPPVREVPLAPAPSTVPGGTGIP